MTTNILIVDDHPLVRAGLEALFVHAEPASRIHAASNATEALTILGDFAFDLAMVDLNLNGMDGINLIRELVGRYPALPVVVVSSSENPADVRRALAAGARGYIPKSAGTNTFLRALQLIRAGEIYVPPFMAMDCLHPVDAQARRLSPRQIEVLRLLCEGLPNKIIAERLGMSEKTTKTHVSAIMRVLAVSSRSGAVTLALKAGLI